MTSSVRLLVCAPQLFAMRLAVLATRTQIKINWSLLTCFIGRPATYGKRAVPSYHEMLSSIAPNYLSALGFRSSHIAKESLLMILVTDHVRGNLL